MSYDTTLDDVMTPPCGAPQRKAAPGKGPWFRSKRTWPPSRRTTLVVLVTIVVTCGLVVLAWRRLALP